MCLRMLGCGKKGWQEGERFLKKNDLFLQSVLEQLKSFSLSPCILLCLSFWFFVCLCFGSELLNLTGNKLLPKHLARAWVFASEKYHTRDRNYEVTLENTLEKSVLKCIFLGLLMFWMFANLGLRGLPSPLPFSSQVSQTGREPGPEGWLGVPSAMWRPSHLSGAALSSSSFIVSQMPHNQHCL